MRVLPFASTIILAEFIDAVAVVEVWAKAAPAPTAVKPKVPRLSAVPRASALLAVEFDLFFVFLDILVPPKEIVDGDRLWSFFQPSSQVSRVEAQRLRF